LTSKFRHTNNILAGKKAINQHFVSYFYFGDSFFFWANSTSFFLYHQTNFNRYILVAKILTGSDSTFSTLIFLDYDNITRSNFIWMLDDYWLVVFFLMLTSWLNLRFNLVVHFELLFLFG